MEVVFRQRQGKSELIDVLDRKILLSMDWSFQRILMYQHGTRTCWLFLTSSSVSNKCLVWYAIWARWSKTLSSSQACTLITCCQSWCHGNDITALLLGQLLMGFAIIVWDSFSSVSDNCKIINLYLRKEKSLTVIFWCLVSHLCQARSWQKPETSFRMEERCSIEPRWRGA